MQRQAVRRPTIPLWPVERNTYGPHTVRVIRRPLGGKEYVVSDHLGSARVVVSDMGVILERKEYRPFGEVLASAGTGARTGYIAREEDGETGLGSYGVRLYEPEYGRFTSVDVMWEGYAAWNVYQYSLSSPVCLLDDGGMWVRAMNSAARDAIRASVPLRFQGAIQFGDDGTLDVTSVKAAAKGEDVNSNIAILSRLAENEHTVHVSVTDKFEWKDGITGRIEEREFSKHSKMNAGDVPEYGITLLPVKDRESANVPSDMPLSSTGTTHVVINPTPMVHQYTLGQVAAHEIYGHFRMLLLAKQGLAIGAGHLTRERRPNPQVDEACREAEKDALR